VSVPIARLESRERRGARRTPVRFRRRRGDEPPRLRERRLWRRFDPDDCLRGFASSLAAAARDGEVVAYHPARHAAFDQNGFTALSTAFLDR
jgi:hypothetical protein